MSPQLRKGYLHFIAHAFKYLDRFYVKRHRIAARAQDVVSEDSPPPSPIIDGSSVASASYATNLAEVRVRRRRDF